MSSRCDDVHASVHREIRLLAERAGRAGARSLLDVGCWDGRRTVEYASAAGIQLADTRGVEFFPEMARMAGRAFTCHRVDIERDALPFEDETVDLVVCNQVMEHCKDIFRPLDEIHRVLRTGGHLVFSVPNLGSLHNRLMLAAGLQPSSIRVLGPHVRGFTHRATSELLSLNGRFEIERVVGVGLYPLPARVGDRVALRMPGISHTTITLARRNSASGPGWEETIRRQGEQTAFFDA